MIISKNAIRISSKKIYFNFPFISFNDIFTPSTDKNKIFQNIILDIYNVAKRSGFKGILLYGPKGSGIT